MTLPPEWKDLSLVMEPSYTVQLCVNGFHLHLSHTGLFVREKLEMNGPLV